MGTNAEKQADSIGKTQFFRSRPAPFVVRWRAFQHELAFKATRLDFLTKISEIVATPRQAQENSGDASAQFRKSILTNSMA